MSNNVKQWTHWSVILSAWRFQPERNPTGPSLRYTDCLFILCLCSAIYLRTRSSRFPRYPVEVQMSLLNVSLPLKFDWRDKHVVTPVRNQQAVSFRNFFFPFFPHLCMRRPIFGQTQCSSLENPSSLWVKLKFTHLVVTRKRESWEEWEAAVNPRVLFLSRELPWFVLSWPLPHAKRLRDISWELPHSF